MPDSHKLMVGTNISTDQESGTAVAYATKWLYNGIGNFGAIHQAYADGHQGEYHVILMVELDDEQLQTVKESETIDHLEAMD